MAGIIISIGNEIQKKHVALVRSYTESKSTSISYECQQENLAITKFCKYSDKKDENVLITDNLDLIVVGHLIFENKCGLLGLKELSERMAGSTINDLASLLDGQFLLVSFSKKNNTVCIVSDSCSLIHLYCLKISDNQFYFTTSSMVLSRNFPVTINENAVAQFLRTEGFCINETLYNEISLIAPDSVYSIDIKKVQCTMRSFFTMKLETDLNKSKREFAAELNSSLIKKISNYTNDQSLFDLTGGFDSRMVVSGAISSNSIPNKIHTFVYGTDSSGEVVCAKNISRKMGWNLTKVELPTDWADIFYEYFIKAFNFSDGELNAASYAKVVWVLEQKKNAFSFSITGMGGDLHRDYWWKQNLINKKGKPNFARLIKMRLLQYEFDQNVFNKKWRTIFADIVTILHDLFKVLLKDVTTSKYYGSQLIENVIWRRSSRHDGNMISASNQIINVVAPLYFKEVISTAFKIPPKFKKGAKIQKKIVKLNSSLLSRLPMLNGMPCEEMGILNWYRFAPQAYDVAIRLLNKIMQMCFHRTILGHPNATNDYRPWSVLLARPEIKSLLQYDSMATRNMYEKESLYNFIENAKKPGFRYYDQLGNMLTLEMRMRKDLIVDAKNGN